MINNNQEWRQSVLLASDSIEQAIKNLNDYANKIIIVADSDFILQGTVSDGDVRRGMISGIKLSDPIHKIMNRTPPNMLLSENFIELLFLAIFHNNYYSKRV